MTLQAVLPCISYHIIDHGTSWLHTSVWSLHFLHHLGPAALGSVHVNHVETCTSMCNLYMYTVCPSPQSHENSEGLSSATNPKPKGLPSQYLLRQA